MKKLPLNLTTSKVDHVLKKWDNDQTFITTTNNVRYLTELQLQFEGEPTANWGVRIDLVGKYTKLCLNLPVVTPNLAK